MSGGRKARVVDTRGVEGVVILEDGKAWPLDFDPFSFYYISTAGKAQPFLFSLQCAVLPQPP